MSFIDDINNVDINDPSSWSNTFRMLVGFICAILIFGLVYHFVVKDKMVALDSFKAKETKLKKDFKKKKELAVNLEAYKDQMVEAENIFSVLKQQLPSETEISDLLTDVTQKGVNRGLRFKEFQPKKAISKGFYNEKPVQIVVSGEYNELAHFVSDIAALPRIVNVGDFDIKLAKKRSNNKGVGSELVMKAVINTYYYKGGK